MSEEALTIGDLSSFLLYAFWVRLENWNDEKKVDIFLRFEGRSFDFRFVFFSSGINARRRGEVKRFIFSFVGKSRWKTVSDIFFFSLFESPKKVNRFGRFWTKNRTKICFCRKPIKNSSTELFCLIRWCWKTSNSIRSLFGIRRGPKSRFWKTFRSPFRAEKFWRFAEVPVRENRRSDNFCFVFTNRIPEKFESATFRSRIWRFLRFDRTSERFRKNRFFSLRRFMKTSLTDIWKKTKPFPKNNLNNLFFKQHKRPTPVRSSKVYPKNMKPKSANEEPCYQEAKSNESRWAERFFAIRVFWFWWVQRFFVLIVVSLIDRIKF